MVIVVTGERHKATTTPTMLSVHYVNIFAANFIESDRTVKDTFQQQKFRLCSLAWDIVILVPHARCTLIGGDCDDRPAGPLLRELLIKNNVIEIGGKEDKKSCMLQAIATYKAGQLITFWLREQDWKLRRQKWYQQNNAISGTVNEWMPVNLLITLLQRWVCSSNIILCQFRHQQP